MLKFPIRREKEKEFRHIVRGLIPAASIAPKPAVPRTPPPHSPNPSPERPRSALAAAILSSSLTGQTWAIPPTRTRSLSESGRSHSFVSRPNISPALYSRDRWSEENPSRPRLSSPDHSEGELEDREEELADEEDEEEHVYQTLDREEICSAPEPVYSLPLKSITPQPTQMSGRREPSPEPTDFSEETSCQSLQAKEKKRPGRKSAENVTDDVPSTFLIPTTDHSSPPSPEHNKIYSKVQKQGARNISEKKTKMADEQKLLEARLQRLEQEIGQTKGFSNPKPSGESQAELQNLRQHAQELVDENDALKLTVHRLNVELSRYQARFRPLSKQEISKISGLPKTGSPPPWLLDMKYLSPLLLAYEDRMSEKDALLQITEEEVKKLRIHTGEVVKENERLHDEIVKIGAVNQKDSHQLQQQAFLVLQENQVLIDQLEAQHAKAKASHSRHNSEVTKVSKQLMLLEVEKQRLQENLEESRRELQKNAKAIQTLQACLKDSVTWEEHCNITGKLKRQLEGQENRNTSEMDKLLQRLSNLEEENRILTMDKANLAAHVKKMEAKLELYQQANRKAERRMNMLKQQKEDCVLKEEKIRLYLGAVISVAENISQERDQLLHTASVLQQEKQGFVGRILNGTVRYGKLQEDVKVYRRQASTRLAALEEAVEGRTASYQREILHLQRLLRERQEAEEKLLQSKREVEEELEVVWQAATRENQLMQETVLDSQFRDLHSWPVPAPDEGSTSSRHQHRHELDFYS
ncbi:centrosomal protein of 89 kDa [Pholidichthys leucotaenia]